jgi:hypothetical protein
MRVGAGWFAASAALGEQAEDERDEPAFSSDLGVVERLDVERSVRERGACDGRR